MSDPTFDTNSPDVQRPIPYATYAGTVKVSHSGLGIASSVIAGINGILLVGLLIWMAGFAVVSVNGTTVPTTPSLAEVFAGAISCGIFFFSIAGIVFGIAGARKKKRKKTWAIIGISLNAIIFCVWIAASLLAAIGY